MNSIFRMEPLVPEDRKQVLEELATELVDRAGRLAGRVHPVLQDGLGDLVRAMNCYYSNLIEGHDTHPVDIDRALSGDYAVDSVDRLRSMTPPNSKLTHSQIYKNRHAGGVKIGVDGDPTSKQNSRSISTY